MFNFILGLIIGGAGVRLLMRSKKFQLNPEQSEQKQKHIQEVLELAKQKGEIKNDDIQYALGVSDATATRYLDELEKDGKLTQSGSGKGIIYRLF